MQTNLLQYHMWIIKTNIFTTFMVQIKGVIDMLLNSRMRRMMGCIFLTFVEHENRRSYKNETYRTNNIKKNMHNLTRGIESYKINI